MHAGERRDKCRKKWYHGLMGKDREIRSVVSEDNKFCKSEFRKALYSWAFANGITIPS